MPAELARPDGDRRGEGEARAAQEQPGRLPTTLVAIRREARRALPGDSRAGAGACDQPSGRAAAFTFLPNGIVYAHRLVVFPFSSPQSLAALQSRVHETWIRFLSYTLKDDMAYSPADCFETFPFPSDWQESADLERRGREYLRLPRRVDGRARRGPDLDLQQVS